MEEANRLQDIQEYYFSQKLREVKSMLESGKPIINLGVGNPDLPPPLNVIKALKKGADNLSKHGYQPYRGTFELRKAIANFYKKYYKVNVNEEDEILPLTGSKEGVMHISMAFLNKGDAVLIPNPGYTTYTSVTKILGSKPIYYNLKKDNKWSIDIGELEKMDLSKVKIMWINYPNMPTGAKASLSLFEKLIAFAKKHQILLINDNPYSFILTDNPMSILAVAGAKEVALELNSLSKSFNIAGWRIGMLLGAAKHIDSVLKVKSNMDSGMFYSLQMGAIKALQMDDKWFAGLNNTYSKRRKIVWKIIDRLGYSYEKNTAGLFVWAKLPKDKNSKEATDYLLKEKHIFVTPGSIFGTNGEGYMRFSLCVDETKLKEVLTRIKDS